MFRVKHDVSRSYGPETVAMGSGQDADPASYQSCHDLFRTAVASAARGLATDDVWRDVVHALHSRVSKLTNRARHKLRAEIIRSLHRANADLSVRESAERISNSFSRYGATRWLSDQHNAVATDPDDQALFEFLTLGPSVSVGQVRRIIGDRRQKVARGAG